MENPNSVIVHIASMLTGQKVDSQILSDALEDICTAFGFCCGYVYDLDQYNIFQLRENYDEGHCLVRDSFPVDDIEPEHRKNLSQKSIYFCIRGQEKSATDTYILDFFEAGTMVIVPITDENVRLSSFLAVCTKQKLQFEDDQFQAMSACMSMLSKYSSQRVYEHRLKYARNTLENIMDNTGIDIYVNDFENHDMLYVNRSMAAPYGGKEGFQGKKCWQALYEDKTGECDFCPKSKLIDEFGNPTKVYSWDYQRPFDGSWFRVFSVAFRWTDGRLAMVVTSVDITENKRNEEIIRRMAEYDLLTQLPNRRKLVNDCNKWIENVGGNGYILFLDLDDFKEVNDTMGHDAGDELLVQIGEYFTQSPDFDDNAYRHGGDEFVVMMDGEGVDKKEVLRIIDNILRRFAQPWLLTDGEVHCNTSIGVASFPKDGIAAEELIQAADMAMYEAKRAGGGVARYADGFNEEE